MGQGAGYEVKGTGGEEADLPVHNTNVHFGNVLSHNFSIHERQ